jgi:hypothetical protein
MFNLMHDALRNFILRRQARQQTKTFLLEVGRAHIQCALVEKELHDLFTSFGYQNVDVPRWLTQDWVAFKKIISEAAVRFNLPKQTVEALDRFRLERNKFTHDIWEDEEGTLRFGNSLDKRTQEVRKFYYTARAFSDLFMELILKGHMHRVDALFANFEEEIKDGQKMIDDFKKQWPELAIHTNP